RQSVLRTCAAGVRRDAAAARAEKRLMERAFRAPGRVNLIGEHTDYNLGFVCPVALQLECRVATTPRADGRLSAFSEQENDGRGWPVEQIPALAPAHHWTDYVIGVAQQIVGAGYRIAPHS